MKENTVSSHNLRKLAFYVLQALLASGAILIGIAILGGMFYLHDASKHAYVDVQSEILSILKNEIILVGVGTSFLFWIGTVRTYMARKIEKEMIRIRRDTGCDPVVAMAGAHFFCADSEKLSKPSS